MTNAKWINSIKTFYHILSIMIFISNAKDFPIQFCCFCLFAFVLALHTSVSMALYGIVEYTNAITNTQQPTLTVLYDRAYRVWWIVNTTTFLFLYHILILIFISFLLPLFFSFYCFSFILMHATKPSSSFICMCV